ncbi:MAG: helix-turn-helix transcriptional regulator [Lachnospiraceae bacterium]|nr:helix-turn-helix transcriptional regulator [Lachnospiraceae bacterium]
MNQQKIGAFLKELRNTKNLTQEQLGEYLGVSRRTVSRWETGSNLPDLDILIEIADYYNVDLRELLDGERKSEKMNKELEETVLKVADYSNEEKKRMTRVMHWLFITGIVSFIIFFILLFIEPDDGTFVYGFAQGATLGIPFAMVVVGAIMTSKYAVKIRAFKKRVLNRITKR